MREALRVTVRANFFFLLFEPLLEASLAKMLTTAVREMGLVQHLRADHALIVIGELFDEFILLHFKFS